MAAHDRSQWGLLRRVRWALAETRHERRFRRARIRDGATTLTDIPYRLLMSIQQATVETTHAGRGMMKNPFDLALYAMLLDRVRPRTIIEIGTKHGGSALWFADRCPEARVITIDIAAPSGIDHPRIQVLTGDADDLSQVLDDDLMAALERPLLVVEDASHEARTVRAVLEFFDPWMREGEYVVVEDGSLTAMGWSDDFGGGPLPAIHEFLSACGGRFVIDREYCDFYGHNVTWNFDGYLRRTAVP